MMLHHDLDVRTVMRRAALAAGVASFVLFAAKRWLRLFSSNTPAEDELLVDFADHRDAKFSLFRRDVSERLESIQMRLENAKCMLHGTPQKTPHASLPMTAVGDAPAQGHSNNDPKFQLPESLVAALQSGGGGGGAEAREDVVAVAKKSPTMNTSVSKTLVELDELLTKLLVDIDGAPVGGLEHLKAERRMILKAVLECSEEVAQLRQS
jgi:hypothetical protein